MSNEERLVDLARQATGDGSIDVAGDFEPRGLMWKRSTGSFVGSSLSDANPLTDQAGDLAGRATADAAVGATGDLPLVVVVAIVVLLCPLPRQRRAGSPADRAIARFRRQAVWSSRRRPHFAQAPQAFPPTNPSHPGTSVASVRGSRKPATSASQPSASTPAPMSRSSLVPG